MKNSLSSLSPLGDREPRSGLKYLGFIYKKNFSSQATSLKLQAGGGWAPNSQATNVKQIILFFLVTYGIFCDSF